MADDTPPPRSARLATPSSSAPPGRSRAVRVVLRPEVRGFERVPDQGPFLVWATTRRQAAPDIPVLLSAWWRERGEDDPIYVLLHSFFMACPVWVH